jgi:hypothetical protein
VIIVLKAQGIQERSGRISPITLLSDVDLGVANFHDFRSIFFLGTTIRASAIVNGLATFMGNQDC